MKENFILSGTYSSGKSTVAEALKKKLPHFHHVADQARVWLNANHRTSDSLNRAEKRDLQLDVMEGYVREEAQAAREGRQAILDSSLVEAYAYSQDILHPRELHVMRQLLQLYKHNYTALVFPPTIPLHDDKLRHTDENFRIHIHKEVVNLLHRFDIPYMYILSQDVRGRVEEVLGYIEKAHLIHM